MRGFVYSFVLGAALFLVMKTPIGNAIGFFGAIPLAVLAQPFQNLPHPTVNKLLIFFPPFTALLAHFVFRRGERSFCDSVFTLFAAAWISFAVGVLQFLCEWQQHGGYSNGQASCNALVPNF
jgi:hypothetical protein